jgi:tetratricopeptide (TPR) repeat protein
VDARAHFEKALAIGEELRSDRIRAGALSGLGSLAMDSGDFDKGLQLREQSLALFRALGDQWLVALITGAVGKMYLAAGDPAKGQRLLREALMLGRSLGSRGAVPYGLEAIADVFARQGDAPRAVRLYGAASVLREALALAYSTTERITYDAALERLHLLVPAEVFEQEWKDGRALSLQGAIDYALEPSTVRG